MYIKEYKYNLIIKRNDNFVIYNTQNGKLYTSTQSEKEIIEEINKTNLKYSEKSISNEYAPVQVDTLIINSAEVCNLKCKYCFADHGKYFSSNTIMDIQVYKKILENIFKINPHGVKNIHFFGGEPLLGINNIEEFCALSVRTYCNENLPCPQFTITTNGTLITEKIIDFFEKYKFAVCISLDGPKEINDLERVSDCYKSVFDVVNSKLELFKNKNILVGCEATISLSQLLKMTDLDLHNYFSFFNALPISYVGIFIASEDYPENIEQNTDINTAILHFYKNYVDYVLNALTLPNFNAIYFTDVVNVLISFMESPHHQICGAGTSQIMFSASGDVYPCQVYYSVRKNKMGNINDIDEILSSIKHNNAIIIDGDKCSECIYSRFCSTCPGDNIKRCGSETKPNKIRCLSTKYLVCSLICKIADIASDPLIYKRFCTNLKNYYDHYHQFSKSNNISC